MPIITLMKLTKLTDVPATDMKTNLNVKNRMQSNKICPATMLANSRSDKLKTLNVDDKNSINGKKNNNGVDAPCGQNNAKYFKPHSLKPINKTPNQVVNPIPKVIAKWLVIVKLYGINPIALNTNINKKIKKIYGKKLPVFFPIYVYTVLYTNK